MHFDASDLEKYIKLEVTLSVGPHNMSGTSTMQILYDDLKPSKLVSVISFLLCGQGLLVGLCTQDYKSMCKAVTISAILVNIQTRDRQHFDQLI